MPEGPPSLGPRFRELGPFGPPPCRNSHTDPFLGNWVRYYWGRPGATGEAHALKANPLGHG